MADIRQTNSNGGEVAMTVTAGDLARMTTNEQDNGGGYVLAAFAKVTHPRGKCGLGERWEEREVAGTRNVFDGDRPQEVVVCKPPRRRVVQIASGTNPQVCGTLAARDGIKTGSRTPNGQDAGEGKLVVAAFDPYEPGGVKSVHQDGAACTVVNGTSPGHHAAIVDLLTGGQATGTLTAAYWKGPGKTQDRSLVLQREVAR